METDRNEQLNKQQVGGHEFLEYRYRWVIVGLMGVMVLINGLLNNTVIPIQHNLTIIYGISEAYASSPVTISFLVYSLMNFPANHIIDKKGLRVSFLLGAGFFTAGALSYAIVNKGYFFSVIGGILVAIGQPFIINCPAKVATYWFFDHNRPLATAIMTGLMLLGTGFGFVLPSLVVKQDATETEAKEQIFILYTAEFCVSAVALVLVYFFMKKEPPTPPSIGAEQQKTDLKESFKIIKKNRNLWLFFSAFIIIYGALLSFSSTVNFQMKAYGYSNEQVSVFAVILLIMGVVGSIVWSLFIKKTGKYGFVMKTVPLASSFIMIMIAIGLAINAQTLIIFVLGGAVGFTITPLIPISFDLGCELAFPIGEAQIIGLLNGGSMILAFILTSIITAAIKFQTQAQATMAMIVYIVLVAAGSICFFFLKIDLKRRKAEQEGHTVDISKVVEQGQAGEKDSQSTDVKESPEVVIEMIGKNYANLNQQQQVYI